MSRQVTAAVAAALDSEQIEPFFAVDLMFDSPSEIFLWTGIGNTTINGKTYIGTGDLLNISSVEETTEIAAKGATISISGVPSDMIALALAEPYQGRECNIYFGVTTDTSAYVEIFSGFMDQMNIQEGADLGQIEIKVENRLIDLERTRTRKYTSAFQKSIYPNDKGLDNVVSIQDQKLPWGAGLES